MKKVVHHIIMYVALQTLVGCGDGKSVRQLPHLGDTPYQHDTILVTYATNPERALTLLDSALLLGNISEYRGQVIRARIYSKSLTEQRLDSAIISLISRIHQIKGGQPCLPQAFSEIPFSLNRNFVVLRLFR